MEIRTKTATVKGPVAWFTGDVWIDGLAESPGRSAWGLSSVHFTPGARSAWHRHAVGQTFYVLEGEGRVQARGQQVSVIRQGEVVTTQANEWHWHGAAPDHFMTHLSVTEGDTAWGDHVSDGEYGGAA